ncbi:uncharacterized protein BN542_02818 [Clostridium sp. CAG:221]|uniref:helix-turn-helix domain-containing protein n=1 Tax=Clostridium sp. CAG:221 TaxID=1262780 RepID=UPI00033ABC02|nr:helix-turn-helix transcriptional regulator [Clostridium sp. CAG:221]CDB14695.1 uncharacterized protein BN542_02818 [Clostridium sp. CAG:221]
MDIAKEIKKILIDKDMTLTDLAEKLGVTQQNVSAKLKKNDMRISEIEKIASLLDYDVDIKFKQKNKG